VQACQKRALALQTSPPPQPPRPPTLRTHPPTLSALSAHPRPPPTSRSPLNPRFSRQSGLLVVAPSTTGGSYRMRTSLVVRGSSPKRRMSASVPIMRITCNGCVALGVRGAGGKGCGDVGHVEGRCWVLNWGGRACPCCGGGEALCMCNESRAITTAAHVVLVDCIGCIELADDAPLNRQVPRLVKLHVVVWCVWVVSVQGCGVTSHMLPSSSTTSHPSHTCGHTPMCAPTHQEHVVHHPLQPGIRHRAHRHRLR